jgi:hypothetical protein
MSDQNSRLTKQKVDSRGRVISAIALFAAALVFIVLLIAIILGVVFGVRLNNRISALEDQLAGTNESFAEFETSRSDIEDRLSALEGSPSASAPQFEVSNFSTTSDITEYDYIDDYITYEGEGVIIEKMGTDADYLVILKQTLVSGGGAYTESNTYKLISVIDGTGDFSTYDSGTVIEMDEPVYEFEILGYITISN